MASAPRIVIQDDKGLTAADRQSLAALSGAVHPPGSPPNPVTAGLEWADATLRAMALAGRAHGLPCRRAAPRRHAWTAARVRVGGVGEVMTAPDARRQGHAKAALKAMWRHLIEVRAGLLPDAVLRTRAPWLLWKAWLAAVHGQAADRAARRFDRVPPGSAPGAGRSGNRAAGAGVLDLRGPPW